MGSYYTKLNGTFYAELLNAFLYEDGTAGTQNQKQKKQRSSRNRTALSSLSKNYVDAKIKVSVKPFQRLAVSKGRAFGRCPQTAKLPYTLGAPRG